MSKPPELRVTRDCWVVLDYALYDEDGDVIEATDDEGGKPIGFVHGYGTLVPGLEAALVGMAAGETRDVEVAPEDGYGAHDPELEVWVDREDFPAEAKVDDEYGANDNDGNETVVRVLEITDDAVLIDTNHALAGETLHFDVMVRAVRKATQAEVARARKEAPKPHLKLFTDPVPPAEPQAALEPRDLRRGHPGLTDDEQ